MHNMEVRKDIAIVYGNGMAAECRLLKFVLVILTISSVQHCLDTDCEVGMSEFQNRYH